MRTAITILVTLLIVWALALLLLHAGADSDDEPSAVAPVEVIAKMTTTTTAPPTTTTTARARTAPMVRAANVSRPTPVVAGTNFDSAHKPPPGRYAGTVNGSPCGDTLPPCRTLWIESKGSPTAQNWKGCGGRGCFGAWQYDPLTWKGYAGYERADLAPLEVQNEKARLDWAMGAGCHHWSAC